MLTSSQPQRSPFIAAAVAAALSTALQFDVRLCACVPVCDAWQARIHPQRGHAFIAAVPIDQQAPAHSLRHCMYSSCVRAYVLLSVVATAARLRLAGTSSGCVLCSVALCAVLDKEI